jgi:prepilin-type processing-associated H-X9-DG protein/prepilin-type N-terminal cleavage/methylation domain-containing protein
MQGRTAFSLVELLVVIGIIAILIALLLPALGRARQQANSLKCLVTLRNMMHAATIHAHDHQGYLPTAGWQWNTDGGVANPEGLGDVGERKYAYYIDDGIKRPLPVTAALAMAMGVQVRTDSRDSLGADLQQEFVKRLFRCPSQEVELPGWTERGDDGGSWIAPDEVSSYDFNEGILGRRPAPHTEDGPRGHLTKVSHQAEVFFACDGRPRDNEGDRCYLLFNFGDNDTLHDFDVKIRNTVLGKEGLDFWRHNQRINVVFLDGHAETFTMDEGGLSRVGLTKGVAE